MIIRRQWVGSARVLQVLNLIGPEGPIAPGKEPRGGNPGRKPREETQGGTPGAGTSGRNPREETQGGQEVSGPQAPQHHNTTGPTAPQHHRSPQPQYTVCSQHHYFHITHHPSIFILNTVSTKEKQREISIARWRK